MMKTYHKSNPASFSPADDTNVDIEQEFKPPQRRYAQLLLIALAVVCIAFVLVARAMSDQRQQAHEQTAQAVAAQSTAVAQVTALAAQIRGISATVEASAAQGMPLADADPATAALQRSKELAYVALAQINNDTELAVLIALEANRAAHTDEAEDVLRRALAMLPFTAPLPSSTESIQNVAFSPNGRLFLTTSAYGPVRLWGMHGFASGRELNGHEGPVTSAQFSPNSQWVLTTSTDKTARLWDVQSGAVITTFSAHRADVLTAGFTTDSARIATASRDQTVRIWDVQGISITVLSANQVGDIEALEWSPDYSLLLATGQGGLLVWDVNAQQLLYRVSNVPETGYFEAHFAPNGKRIVATGGAPVRLLDARSGEVIRTLPHMNGGHAQFSANGRWLLTDGLLWDLNTYRPIYQFAQILPFTPQFSRNGKLVVTSGEPGVLSLWDVQGAQPRLLTTLKTKVETRMAVFSPDSNLLAWVDSRDTASIWYFGSYMNSSRRLPSDYERLLNMVTRSVGRTLTCSERQTYLRETINCTTSAP
jgi:WD40 repeat protein